MPLYTRNEILYQLRLHAPHAHPRRVLEKWDEIDEVINREHDILLPEAVDIAEGLELERLKVRTNYGKTVIDSTVRMTLSSGVIITNAAGVRDPEAAAAFDIRTVRRLLRYMSQYGAAWVLRRRQDAARPMRVYKPHLAREIPLEDDPDVVKAVLAVQRVQERPSVIAPITAVGALAHPKETLVARWYEFDDTGMEDEPWRWTQVVRRVFVSDDEGAVWEERQSDRRTLPFMPMRLVRNHDSEELYQASDVYEGLPLFRAMDELTTKFLKALEDEAFRQAFFANVDAEQIKLMNTVGALNILFASNGGAENPEPRPYWTQPADHRQYLDAFSHWMNRIATVTATSPLELDDRPVGDIPAQTLRVLYGPQLARTEDSGASASEELTIVHRLATSDETGVKVRLAPRLPISEDKAHQNRKGMLDSDAYSALQALIDDGHSRADAQRILDERMEEKRRMQDIENAHLIEMARIQADTQVRVAARNASGGEGD